MRNTILSKKVFSEGRLYSESLKGLYIVYYYRDDFPVFIFDKLSECWYINHSDHIGNDNIRDLLSGVDVVGLSTPDMLRVIAAGNISGLLCGS